MCVNDVGLNLSEGVTRVGSNGELSVSWTDCMQNRKYGKKQIRSEICWLQLGPVLHGQGMEYPASSTPRNVISM